jgi:hypothetical protein
MDNGAYFKNIQELSLKLQEHMSQMVANIENLKATMDMLIAVVQKLEDYAIQSDTRSAQADAKIAKMLDAVKHPVLMESILGLGTIMNNLGLDTASQVFDEARTLINQVEEDATALFMLRDYYSMKITQCQRCGGTGLVELETNENGQQEKEQCPDCFIWRKRLATLLLLNI